MTVAGSIICCDRMGVVVEVASEFIMPTPARGNSSLAFDCDSGIQRGFRETVGGRNATCIDSRARIYFRKTAAVKNSFCGRIEAHHKVISRSCNFFEKARNEGDFQGCVVCGNKVSAW